MTTVNRVDDKGHSHNTPPSLLLEDQPIPMTSEQHLIPPKGSDTYS